MDGGHYSDGHPADFGGKLLLEVDPEVHEEEAHLVRSGKQDEDPVRELEGNKSAEDTRQNQRHETVAVDTYRLEHRRLRLLPRLCGLRCRPVTVQIQNQLHQERQAHADTVDDSRSHRYRLERGRKGFLLVFGVGHVAV